MSCVCALVPFPVTVSVYVPLVALVPTAIFIFEDDGVPPATTDVGVKVIVTLKACRSQTTRPSAANRSSGQC